MIGLFSPWFVTYRLPMMRIILVHGSFQISSLNDCNHFLFILLTYLRARTFYEFQIDVDLIGGTKAATES